MEIKVSCIMPIYNAEKYLRQSIESAVTQSYPNIEVILVNDASNDNTDLICREYLAKYPDKIHYIHRELNGGSSVAAQDGIDYSTGEYLAFLDSDDIFAKNRIESGVELLNNNKDVDIVICDYETIDTDGNKTGRRTSVPEDINNDNLLNYELKRNYIVRGLLMLRKTADAVYDINLRNSDDYDFFLSLIYNGHKVLFTKDVLLFYRVHKENKSSQYAKAKEATKYILSKYNFADLTNKLTSHGINNIKINITLGIVSLLLDNCKQAVEYFNAVKTTEINDEFDILECYFYLAVSYYKLGRYTDSKSCLTYIQNQQNPTVYNNLGVLYALEDKKTQAIDMFNKALLIQPLYLDALHNLNNITHGTASNHFTERVMRTNPVHV